MGRAKVRIEELEKATEYLKEKGVTAIVNYVEVSMSETRESPTFGKFNTNKGSILLGTTVMIDMTDPESKDIVSKVVDAMIVECGTNLGTVMDSMK